MNKHFTTVRDVIEGFAKAMNLVSPEVENHHEKVAYISYRLAEAMELSEQHRMLAFYGALLHDIGGVLKQGRVSLRELELNAGQVSQAGASLLRMLPLALPVSDVVQASQTPWQRLQSVWSGLKLPQQLGQIIHLADAVSLLLNGQKSVLNQVDYVKSCVHQVGEREFSPEVLAAFDKICGKEAVWMDTLYRPALFLGLISDNRWLSLDETVRLTEFMSKIIDFRSPFTAMHSAGVAATATALAELSGMSEDECKMMRIAGYLHDVGKLKIPNSLLEKPGKLTDEEFNVIKEHAYYTYILLKDIRGFEQITDWASLHHEKMNGTGYPFHLQAGEQPLGSRIMTVADIFSAIAEERPYRKSMEREQVIGILRQNADRGLTAPGVTELLIRNYDGINARREQESRAASKKYQESLAAAG